MNKFKALVVGGGGGEGAVAGNTAFGKMAFIKAVANLKRQQEKKISEG